MAASTGRAQSVSRKRKGKGGGKGKKTVGEAVKKQDFGKATKVQRIQAFFINYGASIVIGALLGMATPAPPVPQMDMFDGQGFDTSTFHYASQIVPAITIVNVLNIAAMTVGGDLGMVVLGMAYKWSKAENTMGFCSVLGVYFVEMLLTFLSFGIIPSINMLLFCLQENPVSISQMIMGYEIVLAKKVDVKQEKKEESESEEEDDDDSEVESTH